MKLYKIQFNSCSAWCWAKSSGVVYTGLGCRWLIYVCICVCFLFVFVFVFVFVFACYPGPQVTYIDVKEMPRLLGLIWSEIKQLWDVWLKEYISDM